MAHAALRTQHDIRASAVAPSPHRVATHRQEADAEDDHHERRNGEPTLDRMLPRPEAVKSARPPAARSDVMVLAARSRTDGSPGRMLSAPALALSATEIAVVEGDTSQECDVPDARPSPNEAQKSDGWRQRRGWTRRWWIDAWPSIIEQPLVIDMVYVSP